MLPRRVHCLLRTASVQHVIPVVAAGRAVIAGRRHLSGSTKRTEAASKAPAVPSSSAKASSSALAPSELLTVLQETIKTHGPLPVSRYMTLCLAHPTLGYYTTKKVFGSEGDFVTSPEISQIFGELLALWYVTQWAAQGCPSKVRVVELGPGRGTLLTDILRTFKALPQGSSPPVTSIHLVESSDGLREAQRQKLEKTGFGTIPAQWWGSVDEIPAAEDEFTVIIAHEFFDALPIHIFENTTRGWREVMVDVSDPKSVIVSSTPRQALRLVLAPSPTPASTLYTRIAAAATTSPSKSSILSFDSTLAPPPLTPAASVSPTLSRFARLPVGSRMEISPACWEVARGMSKLLGGGTGGAGLVVDYGDDRAFGRSWRGFRKHQIVDPLSEPGHTDLTANVDFSYLAEAMSDLTTSHGPISQSKFLHALGFDPRLRRLLKDAADDRKTEIESACKRLVDDLGMGKQYKVMAFTPKAEQAVECYPFPAPATGTEKKAE